MAISPLLFGDVLEAVDRLTDDEQHDLVTILQRRLAERNRKRLFDDVREARQEYLEGGGRPATADELMGEILS